MSIRVEFEAANAKMLWQQIVEYIEAAASGKQTAEIQVDVRAEAAKAQAEVVEPAPVASRAGPTPAIVEALRTNDIPEAEWGNVGRTGKNDRMTKADVLSYAKTRTVELLNADPNVPVLDDELFTPGDVTPESAGVTIEAAPEPEAPAVEAVDPFGDMLSGEPTPEPVQLTRPDVNNALKLAYDSEAGGRVKCLALLDRFGVKATRDLGEENFAEFIAAAEGIAAGTHDPALAS